MKRNSLSAGIRQKFRKGDLVELTSDINPIPAGVYKFTGRHGIFFSFCVGRRIRIGISEEGLPLMRRLPAKRLHQRTRPDQFIDRYYLLLEVQKNVRYHPAKPLTYCIMEDSELKSGTFS